MIHNTPNAESLKQQIRSCTKCHLHTLYHDPVPIHLTRRYGVLVIGEAPGNEEDIHNMPFVGPSGRFLRQQLKLSRIPPEYTSFCNVISCRPPYDKKRRRPNRDPLDYEIAACKTNLLAQINIAQPRIILTVGRFSATIFNPTIELRFDHGRPIWLTKSRIQIPTYHPAFVMKQRKSHMRTFEKDLYSASVRLHRGLDILWPETCRYCHQELDELFYDSYGLAYCKNHYDRRAEPSNQPLQMGMV